MCTSLTLPLPDGSALFGRTLDWHEHFHERMMRIPQGFHFPEKGGDGLPSESRHAILGMGTEADGYPLLADGMNACGLCMAGLRFAACAHYLPTSATPPTGYVRLSPWELIPYVLGFCATLSEARAALSRVRVVDRPFPLAAGGTIPQALLHWHVADCRAGTSLVVEATARGLMVYEAPLGVMANAPAYPEMIAAYEHALRNGNTLPTGYDSPARLIRAATLRREVADRLAAHASARRGGAADPVADFFALVAHVSPPLGAVPAVGGAGWQTTIYTACMDGARGLYHYTTAEHPAVRTEAF